MPTVNLNESSAFFFFSAEENRKGFMLGLANLTDFWTFIATETYTRMLALE